MARTGDIQKNIRRMKMVKQKQAQRKALKAIIMNKNTTMEERFETVQKLARLPRNSAANRVRNRCELTGRSRGTYRKFKLSRIKLRDLGGFGMIPGMTKSSW